VKKLILVLTMVVTSFPAFADKELDADGIRKCMNAANDLDQIWHDVELLDNNLNRYKTLINDVEVEISEIDLEISQQFIADMTPTNRLPSPPAEMVSRRNELVTQLDNLVEMHNTRVEPRNSLAADGKNKDEEYNQNCTKVSAPRAIIDEVCDSNNKFCQTLK